MAGIMTFGDWIKVRRKTLDLTQEELARRVGCATSTLKKIELEERRASREMAERLAQALGLSWEEQEQFVRAARGTLAADEWLVFPPAVAVSSTPKGKLLKGYELREPLGAGGFGEVYRAVQPAIGRDVAIKVIRPAFANQPVFIRRFEVEAQLVARLEHPHIVPLYDYWRDPGGAYLVMRYMRGGNLQTKLHTGPFPTQRVLAVLEQVGAALMVAHQQGVVHRDIKPANILLDEVGNAYLADFGIAKELHSTNPLGEMPEERLLASHAYTTPEQIAGEAVTPRTDIYSLGILLYELLAGQHPFHSTPPDDLIVKHLHQPVPAIAPHRTDISAAVDEVIQRATAKDPHRRYVDVGTLIADLRIHLEGRDRHASSALLEQMLLGNAAAATGSGAANAQGGMGVVVENPYKGLRAFQETDARNFFGREALTQHLVARLAERGKYQRFLAVVGPSGSGKSSAVRAGLIPALRSGALPGAEKWFIAQMFPGTHPMEELATALLRVAVETPEQINEALRADEHGLARVVNQLLPTDDMTELVLVVDQFEELFTLVEDEATRLHFLRSLQTAVNAPRSRLRVVVTLRADFYDRPLQYAGFGELMRQRTAAVVALTSQELQRAIVEPAARQGFRVEPELVAAMVADVDQQPGTLPLLQYALTELFERREGHDLKLEAYHAQGGLLRVLARRADQLYDELGVDEQLAVRQLFLRLVTLGEGIEDTRRRVPLAELAGIGGDAQALELVIERYTTYRLLTLDRDPATRSPTVEVAHEALIKTWGRLREWIEASREDLRVQRRLALAAAEWFDSGQEASFLATGARLVQFTTWSTETAVHLNKDEQAYLQQSLGEQARLEQVEHERQERELAMAHESATAHRSAAQRLRYLAGLLTLFLVVAVLLSSFALQSRAVATTSFAQSESQRLAAEANGVMQRGESAELAALLALRGLQAQYSPQADAALQRASRFDYGMRLFPHPDVVNMVVYSPDGKSMLTGANDRVARLWDLRGGHEIRQFTGHTGSITGVAFSRDGRFIITGSADRTARLWNAETGQQLHELVGHTGPLAAVAFSPGGAYVLTAGADDTARLWDVQTGAQRRVVTTSDIKDCCPIAAVSSDDQYFATGSSDGSVQLWDASTGQLVRTFVGHTAPMWSVAFSPDGKQLLTASVDKTARLWNTTTGEPIQTFTGHSQGVFQAVFSPDSKQIFTGSLDTTARLWDVATGKELRRYTAHTASVYSVAFAPDGASVLTGSKDGTVRLWDIRAPVEADTFVGHTSIVYGLAFSPDGKQLLTASIDKTARLWDLATGKELRVLPHSVRVDSVAFSPDGTYLLTGAEDGTRLWDRETGAELHKFGDSWSHGARFSADGTYVVTSGPNNSVQIWERTTGKLLQSVGEHTGGAKGALSSDGRYVVTVGTYENDARLWERATGKQVQVFTHPSGVNTADFSSDGQYLLTASRDNIARLWKVDTGQLVRPFVGHTNIVWSAEFSPDGRQVLTSSQDRSARLWDVATGKQLRLFPGYATSPVSAAVFAPDGQSLAVASFDGIVQVTSADLPALIDSVCARLLRDFTKDERAIYNIAGNRPTCS